MRVEFDAVVDDVDLRGRDAVSGDAEVLGELAHGDDLHRPVHSASLDVVDRLVDMLARTIELGRVDVDHQRLSGELCDRQTGGVGQPVVGVDHVELGALRDFEAELRA